ncbi:hypothetical protein [Acinetobacter sp. SFA]|uniref:hypothetical protein n=1 Tax=Acinetobacter sp. SFA TaxID=1805633 RepID=UPI0012DF9EEE|nr:hypothetical protein [Acinetobacter sp. SFA]
MKIIQGLDLCMSEVSQAMPSLFTPPQATRSFTATQKKLLARAEKLDSEEIHFQLSKAFITTLHQSKINIDQICPNRLLMLFNRHLSRTYLYDLNCRLYDKPPYQPLYEAAGKRSWGVHAISSTIASSKLMMPIVSNFLYFKPNVKR